MTLSKRTAAGATWSIAARVTTRCVDVLTLILMARLLSPADFGVVAIAATLVALVEAVLEIPVYQAVLGNPALGDDHLDTAFTLSLLRGFLVCLAVALLAWPFSHLYGDGRLLPLTCALSLAPVLRSLGSPRMILLVRALNFRSLFLVEVSGKLVAGLVATGASWWFASYWSIVAGTVMAPLVMTAASYVAAPYRPALSLRAWSLFAGFLGWSGATQLATAVNWQCDRLLLGRFASQLQLGQFSMAADLVAVPVQGLIKPILATALPALAAVTDDPGRLRLAYAKIVSALLAVVLPAMLGLALLSEPLVRAVLGAKWLASAPILQGLAIASIPGLLVAPLGALAVALNRMSILLAYSLLELAVRVPLILAGVVWFDIPGVVAAHVISSVLLAGVSMHLVSRLIGLGTFEQVFGPWRPQVGAGLMALAVLPCRPWLADLRDGLIPGLAGVIALGALVYAAALIVQWRLAGSPGGIEAVLVDHARAALAALERRWRRPAKAGERPA